MSSCFGGRKKRSVRLGEDEPLLPIYEDDTVLQRRVHGKLHTYQMFRALSKGYMPSTEQAIINLRTLLSSDAFLSPDIPGLSESGRLLTKRTKQWLTEFIHLLANKNGEDQIQDFIWYLLHAKIRVNTGHMVANATSTATSSRAKADARAAYESLKTVGGLLLTNSDFRLFLSDLNKIGRQVFADTAITLSTVAEDAARQIEPSSENGAGTSDVPSKSNGDQEETISKDDLVAEAAEIGDVVTNGLKKTGQEAVASSKEHVSGEEKDTLLRRLKQAVLKLRKRPDYSDSANTITRLIQRYAEIYSRAVDETVSSVQDDIETNKALDRAVKNAWQVLSAFGDKDAWKELEVCFKRVVAHSQKDPEFESLISEIAESIQNMLTDPDFFESAGRKIDELKEKSKETGTDSPLRKDVDNLVRQARVTFDSVANDEDVSKLLKTTMQIWSILSPTHETTNHELLVDTYSVFIPLLIKTVQYIPIPRLEISVPEADLLLENLILEPGRTINSTSFLPFLLDIQTHNSISLRAARFRNVTRVATLVTVNLKGLSIRGEEIGFWLRARKGVFLHLADEGIASFELDERGIDISLNIEIGEERLEQILTLKDVRVKIHHLSYTLRRSKFACLAWLFKPLLRPLVRKVLEKYISAGIADFFHATNRELVFARERLRATRISDPQDLRTFFKAVMTRLTPEYDPDIYANVGVTGGAEQRGNVFAGVYAPGSVVKLWNEQATRAGDTVDDNEIGGWRNEVFDVHARNLA